MVGLGVDFGDVTRYVADNDARHRRPPRWALATAGSAADSSSPAAWSSTARAWPAARTHGVVVPGTAGSRGPGRRAVRSTLPVAGLPAPDRMGGHRRGRRRLDPRNVYAATKLHQEHLCGSGAGRRAPPSSRCATTTSTGPGCPATRPTPGWRPSSCSALADGRAPQVFEDGGQTRDFVHVRDVARANVLALTTGAEEGAYNVASGTPHTVSEMARALAAGFAPGAATEVTGRWRLGDVRHVVASPRKAAERLGFVAQVAFADGMAELARARADAVTR